MDLSTFYNSVKYQLLCEDLRTNEAVRRDFWLQVLAFTDNRLPSEGVVVTGKENLSKFRAYLNLWNKAYNHGKVWDMGALRQFKVPQWLQSEMWEYYMA